MKKILILFLFLISVSFATSKDEIKGIIANIVGKLPVSTNVGIIIYNPANTGYNISEKCVCFDDTSIQYKVIYNSHGTVASWVEISHYLQK